MKTSLLALVVSLFVFVVTGCASMATVRADRAQGKGDARAYAADEPRAWQAARDVLKTEGASVVEEDKEHHCLWADFPGGVFTYGTVFGACFDPMDASHVRVTAISHRRYQLGFVTDLGEDSFHKKLADKLAASPATAPASATTTTSATAPK